MGSERATSPPPSAQRIDGLATSGRALLRDFGALLDTMEPDESRRDAYTNTFHWAGRSGVALERGWYIGSTTAQHCCEGWWLIMHVHWRR